MRAPRRRLPAIAGVPAPTFTTRPITIPASNGPRQLIIWGSRDGDVSGFEDVRADVSVNPFATTTARRSSGRFSSGTARRTIDSTACGPTARRTAFRRVSRESPWIRRVCWTEPTRRLVPIEMVRGWLLFTFYDEVAEARQVRRPYCHGRRAGAADRRDLEVRNATHHHRSVRRRAARPQHAGRRERDAVNRCLRRDHRRQREQRRRGDHRHISFRTSIAHCATVQRRPSRADSGAARPPR